MRFYCNFLWSAIQLITILSLMIWLPGLQNQLRGHLQTMICTLNVIVTLRGWGVLAVTLIISFLCNRMGMRQKINGVLTCLLYTL